MQIEIIEPNKIVAKERLPEMAVGTVFIHPITGKHLSKLSDKQALNFDDMSVVHFGDDVVFDVTPLKPKCVKYKINHVCFGDVMQGNSFNWGDDTYRKIDDKIALNFTTLRLAKFNSTISVKPAPNITKISITLE